RENVMSVAKKWKFSKGNRSGARTLQSGFERERGSGLQQPQAHQELPGHLIHSAALHVHLVGQLRHLLGGDLARQLVQNVRHLRVLLQQIVPHQKDAVVVGEEALVVLQDLQPDLFVQAVGGVDHRHIEAAVFNGGVLQAHIHRDRVLEIQTVELHKGVILHAALQGEELLLRAEGQLVRNGDEVADGLQAVLVRQGLGHADGVGVFKAQLLQLGEAVAVQLALDVVV
ncbi:Stage 0 sporulation A-like protein, partial [Dysosmobacter welbionis]